MTEPASIEKCNSPQPDGVAGGPYRHELGRLLGQLALGLTGGFLLLIAARLVLLPRFGLGAHSPYLILPLLLMGGALFLPWLSWLERPARLRMGLGFVTLLLTLLVSITAWRVGVPSLWKLPLAGALMALLAVSFELDSAPDRRRRRGLAHARLALLAVFSLFLLVVSQLVWFGPGGEEQNARVLFRALVSAAAVFLVWYWRLRGYARGEALDRNLETCAALLLIWLAAGLAVLALGFEWFDRHSPQVMPAARIWILVLVFPALLGAYLSATTRRWLPALMLLLALLFSLGLPPAPELVLPMLPVAGLVCGLFVPRRWWPLAIVLWAIVVAPFVNALGVGHSQLIVYGLSGSVIMIASLWLNRRVVDLVAAAVADAGGPTAGPARLPGRQTSRISTSVGIVIAMLVTLLGGAWLSRDYQQERANTRKQAEAAARYLASNVEATLKRGEHLARAMSRLRHLQTISSQQAYEQETAELVQMAGEGITLEWATGTTLRYIHPLAGNERAVGLDLLSLPYQAAGVRDMIASGEPYWSEPIHLVQGGIGMLYRVPVYRDPDNPSPELFQGIAVSLVSFPAALRTFLAGEARFDFQVSIATDAGSPLQVLAAEAAASAGADLSQRRIGPDRVAGRALVNHVPTAADRAKQAVRIEVVAQPRKVATVQRVPVNLQVLVIGAVLIGLLVRSLVHSRMRQRAMAQIEGEFAQMQQILDHSVVGALIADEHGDVVWQNTRASEVLNTPAEVIHDTNLWQNRIWREQGWDRMAQATLDDNRERVFEYEGHGTLGQAIDIQATLSRVQLGGRYHLLVQALHIGESRALQRELAAANANLELTVEERTQALDRARRFSDSLVDTMGSVFVLLDANGRIVRFNQAAQGITGFSFEELQNRPIWDCLIPADAQAAVRDVFNSLRSDRVVGYFENEWLTKAGERRLFAWHNTVLHDDAGQVSHAMAIGVDITEQRANERELQDHRDALERLVEKRTAEIGETARRLEVATRTTGVGIWVLDLATGIADWDALMFEMFGVPEDERDRPIDFDFVLARVHPDDVARVEASYRSLLCGDEPDKRSREYRIVLPDGGIRYFAYAVIMERDSDGRPVRVIGSNWDISDSRLAEQALQASQQRLRNILESAQAGTWEWNVQTGETRFNQRWAEIIGYRLEELEPTTIDTWTRQAHPDDLQASNDALLRHFAGEADYYRCEARMRHRDGHWVWVLDHGRVVSRTEDGKPLWMFGTHLDISDRKQLELDLVAATRAAKESSDAKSEFLSNMSHEIRTPLNGVLGLLQLLRSTELDAQQSDYVQKAYTASSVLLGILNDVLDYSRIEARKMALNNAPFALRQELNNALSVLSNEADRKGVALSVTIDPDCPDQLLGDVLRLEQVLLNLTSNAIKFTEHGEIAVRVSIDTSRPGKSPTVWLRFEVRDTGIGVEAAQLERIFERFAQAETGAARPHAGTGLGLSICAGLVHLMNGEIEAESTPGEGSRFWFVLPLQLVDAARREAETPKRRATDEVPALQPGALAGLRILSVEDNPLNQEVNASLLGNAGASVDLAANGREAVSRVLQADTPYDLVLMDVRMPVMGGIEATRLLRKEHQFTDLPIIAMTANAQPSDREACLAAGMDDYLAKPVAVDLLLRVIEQYSGRTAADHPASSQAVGSRRGEPGPSGFDLDGAISRLGGQAELHAKLVRKFLAGFDATQGELLALMDDPSAEASRKAARKLHTLRGSALTLGAVELAETSRAMELALPSASMQEKAEMRERLQLAFERVRATLRGIVEARTSTSAKPYDK